MNRLSQSLSPYLLQHQTNPVDWYPWGEEAFERARQTDRPIFLSVGYAACHWCHVMEHESFENQLVAEFLNDHFVSIKVDREERPDIDQVYMNAVQMMTGHGGWPMSVFLNHGRQPFYAGTYWPPTARQGMPGFSQVLDAINDAWTGRRDEVCGHASQITDALEKLASGDAGGSRVDAGGGEMPSAEVPALATDHLLRVLDSKEGGFGAAPKFPHATDLELLFHRATVSGNPALVDAAVLTLDKMASGGIRDHIGGGFARYSVDAQWLVPHFEKMLYDNALLAKVYLRAFQVTGQQRHGDVACQVLDYLIRDMTDSSGGFHCSEDADSEGVEGKFYVWTPDEVMAVLGEERGRRFCETYDITPGGNFEGSSIPRLRQPVESQSLQEELIVDCDRLRRVRNQRVHPGRDDKILVAWNALAIQALALAGAILDRPDYIAAAVRAGEFVFDHMTRKDGRLLHAYRSGQAHLDAYLDDHGCLAEACIGLFEATGDAAWIVRAISLGETMIEHFEDRQQGGFFYTAHDAERLIARNKDWHDGALVSGNASAASALMQLAALTDRDDFRIAAERTLIAGHDVLSTQAAACGALVTVLDRYHGESQQWVIAVPSVLSSKEAMREIRSHLFRQYHPRVTVSWVIGDPVSSQEIVKLNHGRRVLDGKPTLYPCTKFRCHAPVVGGLPEWLAQMAPAISRLGS